MNTCIPLYMYDRETAVAKGDLGKWKTSYLENCRCVTVIDKTIGNNFKNYYLDTDTIIKTITAHFSIDRILYIFASVVYHHAWDGRYQQDVINWANTYMDTFSRGFCMEGKDYILKSHTTLINSVIYNLVFQPKTEKLMDSTNTQLTISEAIVTPTDTKTKLTDLMAKLESGVSEIFSSGKYQAYLNAISKFHKYSSNNILLIMVQKPEASRVAGYHTWKKQFNRTVNKGEKAIKIMAPVTYKIVKQEVNHDSDADKPVARKDEEPILEDVEKVVQAFKIVNVFDISQTSGDPIPQLGVQELKGTVSDYEKFFNVLREVSPVPIETKTLKNSVNGYYDLIAKKIAIRDGMSQVHTIKTAIHEISHAKLHDINIHKPRNPSEMKDTVTREVEAESIAYTVCQYFGIDTSDYSFGYIAGWSEDKETIKLKASLETIRDTASKFIEEINDKYFGAMNEEDTYKEVS